MNKSALNSEETTLVRDGYEVDIHKLSEWMRENISDFKGPVNITQFKGGQSNPTYRLNTPSKSYILRKQPPGDIVKGAHAVDREAHIMAALKMQNFPVPQIYGVCTNTEIIGTIFIVMEEVVGRIFWDATLPNIPKNERAAYYNAMNATLAQLHAINPSDTGLNNYGKTGNYLKRQIDRWSRQYLENPSAGTNPHMDKLVEWLPQNIPDDGDETRIVHGDFRIDNIIFHPSKPQVLAVLDWELSTLGNPLSDFAYHAMTYRTPPHIVAGLADEDPLELGLPSEAQYIEKYCHLTGRNKIDNFDYYIAFNFFRLAAILHGIAGRISNGTATSETAHERANAFPEVAKLAWDQLYPTSP